MSTPELRPVPPPEQPQYDQCDQCGAPLDTGQRYCVVCATRRRDVADPAARFMSAATAHARTEARLRQATAGTRRARRSPGLGTAAVIALLPLAVGLGVLIGRSSNSQDAKLLAAIRAERRQVLTVAGTAAPATGAAAGVTSVSTSFPLASGYAIELSALPAGSRQSAAAGAEAAARAKGATSVGLIGTSDYSISPKPAGAYVIYSGAFPSRAAADRALARLRARFPHAEVIAVRAATAGGGRVLTRTRFGSATQASGYKPSQQNLAQGAAVANGVAKKIGKSYVGSQSGLPSVVSVP